ncbi:MAG: type II toxin-antitoxin system RelE/ParE family toxin [Bacteroidota bacterium]
MAFNIIVLPSAIRDVQEIIDYYDSLQQGLSLKFDKELNNYFLTLQKNPFFQTRYANVHCLPLKKFPVMIHFTIDEKLNAVYIRAVLNTSKNPRWE